MRCNACGNEIPNGVTMCPFCGSTIKNDEETKAQESGVVENTNIQNNLSSTTLTQENSSVTTTGIESENVQQNVQPNMQESIQENVQPNIQENVQDNSNEASYVLDATGEQPIVTSNATLVSPTLEPVHKKSKKGLIIGIIIAIIVVIIACACAFGYMYLYRSADKRISNVIDNAFKNVSTTSDETKASGSLSIDGRLSVGSTSYSAKLSANYGVDLTNKLINLDLSVDNLNVGMNLLNEALKVNTTIKDSNVYLYFSNFYDKYIYTKVDGLDDIFKNTTTESIDKKVLVDGFKNAMKDGLNAAEKTQKMKSNSNVVTIKLNKENQAKIANAAKKSVLNNDKFLAELSKISGKTKEEVKSSLEKETITEKIEDADGYIELVTNILGNKFEEMNIKTSIFEINITNENISFKSLDEKGKEQANGKITFTSKKGAKKNEATVKVDMTAYISGKAYTIELNVAASNDVNPSIESPDLKNAVDASSLTEEDMNTIKQKISQFGNLGSIIAPYLTTSSTQTSTDITE